MLVRKEGETKWHAPAVTQYADEAKLEILLRESPEILPGTSGTVAVASQLQVPDVGPADIVVIDQAGAITVVECKLKANPEIRRWVIGQVFSYAAGIGEMSFEELDSAWAKRTGTSITKSFEGIDTDAWDSGAFVTNVAENLESGQFRLVIAVDKMTEELQRTIRYINTHSRGDFQLLGLELSYVSDGGFEILTPTLYGEESAAASQSTGSKRKPWDESSFFEELARNVDQSIVDIARRLQTWATDHQMVIAWGTGVRTGTMNLRLPEANYAFVQVSTDGKYTLSWGWPHLLPKSTRDAVRQRHLERLNRIPGLSLPLGKGWRTFPLKAVAEASRFDALCAAIEEVIAEAAVPKEESPVGADT
jgi:hypothetical protein